jgi:hypothetical protein
MAGILEAGVGEGLFDWEEFMAPVSGRVHAAMGSAVRMRRAWRLCMDGAVSELLIAIPARGRSIFPADRMVGGRW